MVELKLAVGIYSDASFDDLVGGVLSHNIPLLKSYRILDRRPHRMSMICSSGALNCKFRAYAVAVPSNDGIKLPNSNSTAVKILILVLVRLRHRYYPKFDSWDLRWRGSFWHLQTWRSQYLKKIHRAGVSGTDLFQTDLIPGELGREPGRKRVRLYKPSTSNSRRCGSCGLFGHYSKSCSSLNIAKIVESKKKRAKKPPENVIIDLTQDE